MTFLVWFVTSSKKNAKGKLPKMFYKMATEGGPVSRVTNLHASPAIHLLMDNLGDFFFFKQSNHLTPLFPSIFYLFTIPLYPLFSDYTISSTKSCLRDTHTHTPTEIYFIFEHNIHRQSVRDYSNHSFKSFAIRHGIKRGATQSDSRNTAPQNVMLV